ncbi:unnamed protein product [Microthlaspi erraticum]|uniref:Uncharacterized protein n=1 Tax=Microthlaspi erraticum TaxID=1685480 RepID=A0A6D2JGN2_9BRAS|nr:unnamed protein product [Microthlaspi erraticum]
MLKQLLQGQADGVVDTSKKLAEINSKIENLNTSYSEPQGTVQGHLHSRGLVEEEDQERVIEEFCLLLNDDEIVAAEAPGVQIDQPEVQAPTVALHTSPVELAQQARSAARSSRTLARSSPTSSVPKPILLDPYQPVALPRLAYLVKGTRKGPEESTHQFNLLTSPTFLPKVKDQGKFTLPCTLGHLELDNALVDSGASINLISLSMAEKLGIAGALQRPTTSIMFGDATSKSPLGVFKNYHLKIGECIIQTDLTVMEMEEEKDLPLLLGTPFLSTVGASIDFHKQEVILHKVNSLVSYRLQPRGSDFCATIDSTTLSSKSHEATKVVKERVDKEPRVGKDKVDRGPRIEKPRLERARVEKPRPFIKPSQLTMTLFPTKFENGKIEYKIRYKGRSRPFSRAKALVTSEQSRDPTKLKELLSQVLTITLDGGTSSTNA